MAVSPRLTKRTDLAEPSAETCADTTAPTGSTLVALTPVVARVASSGPVAGKADAQPGPTSETSAAIGCHVSAIILCTSPGG
jgi:hypothetical protein